MTVVTGDWSTTHDAAAFNPPIPTMDPVYGMGRPGGSTAGDEKKSLPPPYIELRHLQVVQTVYSQYTELHRTLY